MSPTPDVLVRRASAADEAALAAIDATAWSPLSAFPSVFEAAGQASGVFFSSDSPPEVHLVAQAEDGGRVLGYIRLKPPTSLPENAHVVLVSGLAVDPAARGRGVAAALLAAAEQEALAGGARKLSLRVLSTNEAAIRLYDRAGFAREGILRGEFRIGDRYIDDVLMAKPLRPADGATDGTTGHAAP